MHTSHVEKLSNSLLFQQLKEYAFIASCIVNANSAVRTRQFIIQQHRHVPIELNCAGTLANFLRLSTVVLACIVSHLFAVTVMIIVQFLRMHTKLN